MRTKPLLFTREGESSRYAILLMGEDQAISNRLISCLSYQGYCFYKIRVTSDKANYNNKLMFFIIRYPKFKHKNFFLLVGNLAREVPSVTSYHMGLSIGIYSKKSLKYITVEIWMQNSHL